MVSLRFPPDQPRPCLQSAPPGSQVHYRIASTQTRGAPPDMWGLLALYLAGGQAPWSHTQVRAPAQLVLRARLTRHRVKSVCALTSRAGIVSPSQSLSESPARGRCCEPRSLLATGGGGAKWTYGVSETHYQKKFM